MSRPDDIPQDVWDYAEIALKFVPSGDDNAQIASVARAILDERERCEMIAQAEIDRTKRRMAETPDEPRMLVNQAWGMCGDTAAIIREAIRKGGE